MGTEVSFYSLESIILKNHWIMCLRWIHATIVGSFLIENMSKVDVNETRTGKSTHKGAKERASERADLECCALYWMDGGKRRKVYVSKPKPSTKGKVATQWSEEQKQSQTFSVPSISNRPSLISLWASYSWQLIRRAMPRLTNIH